MNLTLRDNTTPRKGKLSVCSSLMLLTLASSFLGSCTHFKDQAIVEDDVVIYDPFEESNRHIMAFNAGVDHILIHPIIKGYRTVTPQPVRNGIRNFLRNLRSPLTIANQLLQGDLGGAGDATVRAVVNTTVGFGGLFDVAGHEGIKYEPEDFGQTLAVWGVPHGPYMVVPFIGPSSMRDYSGYFIDGLADPVRWHLMNSTHNDGLYYAKVGADYLDIRDSLYDVMTELEASSIDYYASVRSTYFQHRQALVEDQQGAATASTPAIPNYDAGDE